MATAGRRWWRKRARPRPTAFERWTRFGGGAAPHRPRSFRLPLFRFFSFFLFSNPPPRRRGGALLPSPLSLSRRAPEGAGRAATRPGRAARPRPPRSSPALTGTPGPLSGCLDGWIYGCIPWIYGGIPWMHGCMDPPDGWIPGASERLVQEVRGRGGARRGRALAPGADAGWWMPIRWMPGGGCRAVDAGRWRVGGWEGGG